MAPTYPQLYVLIRNHDRALMRPERYEGDMCEDPLISDLCWELIRRCGSATHARTRRDETALLT